MYLRTFIFISNCILFSYFLFWLFTVIYERFLVLVWSNFFDIIPCSKDKTNTVTYDNEVKMFEDKYGTQIPNSKLFISSRSTNNSKTKGNDNVVNDKKNKIYVNFGKIEEI